MSLYTLEVAHEDTSKFMLQFTSLEKMILYLHGQIYCNIWKKTNKSNLKNAIIKLRAYGTVMYGIKKI